MRKLPCRHYYLTFLILVLFLLGTNVLAQNPVSFGHEQNHFFISFDEKINLNQLGLHPTDSFDWEIRNANNTLVVNQSFGSIDSYIFSLPGEYTLSISNISAQQPSECNHSRNPETWSISVSHYQVKFDVQQLNFSSSLTTENLQNGLFVDVPVTLTIFSDSTQAIDLKEMKVMVQGVGCQISVIPSVQQTNLTPGQHNLQFTLKGNSIKHSYIMIDFIDQNGTISTYYHPQSL